MTEAEIRRTLAAAKGAALDFLGAKIAIRPPEAPVQARLDMVGDLLGMLARAGPQPPRTNTSVAAST